MSQQFYGNNKDNPKNLNLTTFKEVSLFFWRKNLLKIEIFEKITHQKCNKTQMGVIFLNFLKKSRLSIWIWLLLKKIWTKIWKKNSYCVLLSCHNKIFYNKMNMSICNCTIFYISRPMCLAWFADHDRSIFLNEAIYSRRNTSKRTVAFFRRW